MKQLVIIRGNSGSGKTTLAKKLRIKIKKELPNTKVAVIGQDAIRRKMLDEQGVNGTQDNVDLLELTINFCLERNYIVIIEGILNTHIYYEMFKRVAEEVRSHIYYLDVSFEETLRRHETKREDLKQAFGENEMKDWYLEKDLLSLPGEIIIPEDSSLDKSLSKMYGDIEKYL